MLSILVVFLALVIGITLLATFFGLSAKKKTPTHTPLAPPMGDSISIGELKMLIRDAVEESNAPLRNRIHHLEQHLQSEEPQFLDDTTDPDRQRTALRKTST